VGTKSMSSGPSQIVWPISLYEAMDDPLLITWVVYNFAIDRRYIDYPARSVSADE